jgi:hypothetical protein
MFLKEQYLLLGVPRWQNCASFPGIIVLTEEIYVLPELRLRCW